MTIRLAICPECSRAVDLLMTVDEREPAVCVECAGLVGRVFVTTRPPEYFRPLAEVLTERQRQTAKLVDPASV